jgi:hypothetical protein
MQATSSKDLIAERAPPYRQLFSLWKEAVLVATLVAIGALAAALQKTPGNVVGEVPGLMDSICSGSSRS